MEDAAHALQRITERERTAALTRELPMTVPVTVGPPRLDHAKTLRWRPDHGAVIEGSRQHGGAADEGFR